MSPSTIKAAIIVALCAALLAIGAEGGREYTQSKWNKQKAADSEAHLNEVILYANEIVRKDEEHDANQGINKSLAGDVSGSGRVQIEYSRCIPNAKNPDPDRKAGIFSGEARKAFEELRQSEKEFQQSIEELRRVEKEFKRGGDEDSLRADELNVDAIRANR